MRSHIRFAIVAVALAAFCVVACGSSVAGGKGRGGGGGRGGSGHGHGGGNHATAHRSKPNAGPRHSQSGVARETHGAKPQVTRDAHRPKQQFARDARRPEHVRPHQADRATGPELSSSDHPWSKQRANEERKLQHRLDVADRLDKLADANGNEHLRETAERMRQKAHDHYDKRLSKIDSKSPLEVPDDVEPGPLPDPQQSLADAARRAAGEPLAALPDGIAPTKLTGRENALHRQLLNEERKLSERTEVAERLRALAEEQGDAELLQAADRLEEQGLNHFEQRMEAIRSFQDRHGLALEN